MSGQKVFINCPFDNQYFPLLKALLFTIIYSGLKPLISETSDSGEIRLHKIKDLMLETQYSIHDLSRIEPLKDGDLPRFNMPFECGIDFGIKLSNPGQGDKRFLILEKEQYRYQKVISDISGNDIKSHKNEPELLIKAVRDWFKPAIEDIPFYKSIWLAYCEFESDFENALKSSGYNPKEISELTFCDIIEYMTIWIESFKAKL
jgi:hypothetical protein